MRGMRLACGGGAAVLVLAAIIAPSLAQKDKQPQAPDEPLPKNILDRLEWFQDQKFGFFVHWGPYSQLGCIESWPMVWADRHWSNPSIKTKEEITAFRKKYVDQYKTFNPTKFDPRTWAGLAKRAGMKYFVFTTKHHDGFCMFDTQLTDYKITSPDCPYSKSAKPDIVAELFDTFRKEGFGIGAYYSKSDWHHSCYWDPAVFAEDRNPNYDTLKHPDKWNTFVEYVHGQIEELTTKYGQIDILWLDGGQVRPPKQDIQMDKLVERARKKNPDLIVVDRGVRGKYENYRTPEQSVPDRPQPYVWESCLTMGDQWSYNEEDEYKSTHELIHLLIDVVAKGGNLLLNVGPRPDGQLPAQAVTRLNRIGDWMQVNAEAIHGTRPVAPYKEGDVAFTSKGKTTYAIVLFDRHGHRVPTTVKFSGLKPAAGSEVKMLGVNEALQWTADDKGIAVTIPKTVREYPPSKHAFVLKFIRE